MSETIRQTRSVCPVCLQNLSVSLEREADGSVWLEKRCPAHGPFRVPVWRGRLDFARWTVQAEPLAPGAGAACPGNCGLCPEHEAASCCVLLEVTRRCDLRCRFCFANGGAAEADPSLDDMKAAIRAIAEGCGGPLLQLSGGEPTQREDLAELVRCAKEAGCDAVQLNTNGLRLARDPAYAEALAKAGLDIVFLQFDGVSDGPYKFLRGGPLLEEKLAAVRRCGELGLGVTLVPTVVRGVNEKELGALVRLAASLSPTVRGVHFQPVSWFGRVPEAPEVEERYTLDELMADLAEQTGLSADVFLPSRCDHPLCGFHASLLVGREGELQPLSSSARIPVGRSSAKENRDYVARHWRRPATEPEPPGDDFDAFLYRLRHHSLSLTAMAFQDAGNLNIERLRRCSLHVWQAGRPVPFCARYLTPLDGGTP